MRRILALVIIILLAGDSAFAVRNRPVASVPFEMVGSFVVINVSVNGSGRLRFILDTGVRNTIITELHAEDSVDLEYSRMRELQGLGSGNVMNAYVSDGNTFQLNRKFKLSNRSVFVLTDDIFNLSRQTGSKINGIAGADFFANHVVAIDYSRRRLRFYDPATFVAPDDFGVMPMTLEGQKMYLHLSVLETEEELRTIKMLIDTGAELTAWFQTLTNNAVRIPQKSVKGRIGEGLSGEVTGIYARVPQICIANYCVRNPVVVFPDPQSIAGIIRDTDRDGTIGGQLLRRFNVIIDTHHRKFYFKPNAYFKKEFKYNVAGLEVVQAIDGIPQFEVIHVWDESPAARAGLRDGDMITAIDGQNVFSMTLAEMRAVFEKPSSRLLRIKVQRESKMLDFELDMKPRI